MSFIGSTSSTHAVTSSSQSHSSNTCLKLWWIIGEKAPKDGPSVILSSTLPEACFRCCRWCWTLTTTVRIFPFTLFFLFSGWFRLFNIMPSQMTGPQSLEILPSSDWDFSRCCSTSYSLFSITSCIGSYKSFSFCAFLSRIVEFLWVYVVLYARSQYKQINSRRVFSLRCGNT